MPDSVYEIPAGHDAWVIGDEPWVTLEWTSARDFGVSPEGPGERILATVLFTDIVDSTAILQHVGDAAWRDLLATHNRLLREDLQPVPRARDRHDRGRVSRGLRWRNPCSPLWPRDDALRSTGGPGDPGRPPHGRGRDGRDQCSRRRGPRGRASDVIRDGPSEVLVSWTTKDLLEGAGLALEDAGSHELKGLDGERHLFSVVPPGPTPD